MVNKEKRKSMVWVLFALGAALSWGLYGPMMHKGQVELGSPLRALLCVGFAYFLMAVLVPGITMISSGGIGNMNSQGVISSTIGGALGALGAICVIWAFRNGGVPTYVMPIVFGGAPVVNVAYSMYAHPPKGDVNPLLYIGMILVACGAGMVLYFKPSS